MIRSPRVNTSATDADGSSRQALRSGAYVIALLLAVPTCGGPEPIVPGTRSDPVVATVDGVGIHASDVAVQMQRRGTTDRRAALEDCLTFEVLARAAAGRATEPDAAAQAAVRQAIVQRLVEREIEPLLTRQAIPDAEVRALYEKGKPRFVHGRLVQATVMGFFTGARMKAEPRAHAERTARLLEAFLNEHPDIDAAALAKDPSWAERKLSVSTVWQEENRDEPYPLIVGRALASLHHPGARTPLLIDETGAYIARYLDEKPPENRSFEQVAPELRDEMFEPWRRQRFQRLVTDMAAGHDVAIDPEAVALMASGASSGDPETR